MTFTTLTFLVFLPVVFALYWSQPTQRRRNLVIVLASYFFYGWWDYRFCVLMLGTSLVDFGVGIGLGRVEAPLWRRRLLLASVAANLGSLGFFKYANFFLDNLVASASAVGIRLDPHTLGVVLPVGISFYTFQAMSYTIDVYRREMPPTRSLVEFLAYISFFPQLVAGPIERAPRLLPQFTSPRRFDFAEAKEGCRQILWGFFKKMALADNLATIVDGAFAWPAFASGPQLAFATVAFAFQIYCDFSAYSDIALGTAKLFGVRLMRNFDHPYFSANLREFWQRWHISLSTWFRDYVYVSLGGSRVSPRRRFVNVVATFLLSGLWHGASWNFVLWGGLNGIIVALTRRDIRPGQPSEKRRRLAGVASTFLLVCLLWIPFRAETLSDAWLILRKIGTEAFASEGYVHLWSSLTADSLTLWALGATLAFVAVEWWKRDDEHALASVGLLPRFARVAVYSACVWATLALAARKTGQFVYFQF